VVCENGEVDMRGCYCALAVAEILGLLPDERITSGVGDYIARC